MLTNTTRIGISVRTLRMEGKMDGNANPRLQSVDKDVAPRYHALISAFHAKTGVPILLNTSFNENEPIVNAPEQALAC